MKQVKWSRKGSDLELEVDDGDGKGFKPYTQSKYYVRDMPNFSKGLATFRNCLKNDFNVLPASK